MSKKIRIIAIVLALVLVVGIMPLSIFAADEAETPEASVASEAPAAPEVSFTNPFYDRWSEDQYRAAGVEYLKTSVLKYTDTGTKSKTFLKAYTVPAAQSEDGKAYLLVDTVATTVEPWLTIRENEDGSYTLMSKLNTDEKYGYWTAYNPIGQSNTVPADYQNNIVEVDGKSYYKVPNKSAATYGDINYYDTYNLGYKTEKVISNFRIMAGEDFSKGGGEFFRYRYYWKDAEGNASKVVTANVITGSKKADGKIHIMYGGKDLGILRDDVYTDIALSQYIVKANPTDKTGSFVCDIYINGVKVIDGHVLMKDVVSEFRPNLLGCWISNSYLWEGARITYAPTQHYSGEFVNENTNPYNGVVQASNGYYIYENARPVSYIDPDNYVEIKNAAVTSGENLGIDLTVALPKNVAVTKAVLTYDDGTVAPPAEEGGAATAVPQTKEFVFADMTPNADGTYTISYVTPAGASISDGFTLEFFNVTPGVDGAPDVETKVSVLEGATVVETYSTNVFAALKTAIEVGDANLAAAINAVTQDLKTKTAALEAALANKMDALEVSNSIRDLRTQLEGLYKAADDALREQIDGVSKEVTDLKTALETAKTTLNGAIEQLRTDLENKTAELAAAIATKADNTEMLTKYSELKSAYEAADLVLESNDEALAAADAAMAAAINELKKTVDDHAARLDSIDTMNTVQLVLIIVVALITVAALVLPIVKGKKKEEA